MVARASDANQRSAAEHLPATNTLNGSDNVEISYANELALGISDVYPASFSTITLNTADCNLTRTNIDPNKYDLQDIATHEMDEVLAIGSILGNVSRNGAPVPTDGISPEDFFRYSAGPNGTPDFTTDANAAVYFSIDGGNTDLAQFNQDVSGDFNDWYSINGGQTPQVQDAFGTPGVVSNYNVEPVVLDALGFTPTRTLGTGIVTGNVFNDVNGDGIQDQSDANLSGWIVEAIQNSKVVTKAISNAYNFQLGSLPDGTYTIEVVPQQGYTQTTPVSSYSVTIAGQNDTISNMNFGELPMSVGPLSGTVYKDVSGNGSLDGSQLALAGVKITLREDVNNNGRLDAKDKVIGTVVTDSSGRYSFTGLLAGTYFVTQTPPKGYLRTSPALINTETVTLDAGQQATDQNFLDYQRLAPPAVKKITYTIGSKTYKGFHGHTQNGGTVTVNFTVTRPAGEQLSFASYTAPAAVITPATANLEQLFDSTTNFYTPGSYSLSITLPASGFYRIDFVGGAVITQFGPAGSALFYTSQGRLIAQG